MSHNPDAVMYPDLFREIFWDWGPITAQFERCSTPPELIGNVNLIGHSGGQWLVLRVAPGAWTMPGGTLEPDEHYPDALRREMMEEAGAEVISYQPLGAWRCISHAEKPYRSHMPHPTFYRFVCVGEVRLVSSPLNPADAEQITSVDLVPLDEVVRRFMAENRPEMAQLYQFAASTLG